jgi:hypothetical protein
MLLNCTNHLSVEPMMSPFIAIQQYGEPTRVDTDVAYTFMAFVDVLFATVVLRRAHEM